MVAAGFIGKAAPTAGNIGYTREIAPTLIAEKEQHVAIYDMTHADEVMRPVQGGITQTLNARMGTGGNQVPVVHSYCIAGNTIDRKIENGGNGKGVLAETSYTLNTIDRHAVVEVYGAKSFSEYEKGHSEPQEETMAAEARTSHCALETGKPIMHDYKKKQGRSTVCTISRLS